MIRTQVETKPGNPSIDVGIFKIGEDAFQELQSALDESRDSYEMRCFVWRDDETGNAAARKLLEAADRGVKITIHKDVMGAMYEHFDPNMHSFFHKKLGIGDYLKLKGLCWAYSHGPPKKQHPNPLADAMEEHPNIHLYHRKKLHSHSKIFIFDEKVLFIGGMGIGNDFRSEWVDLLVRIDSKEVVKRYHERLQGIAPEELAPPLDFLLNVNTPDGKRHYRVLEKRLETLNTVKKSLTMEMAYLGDTRITEPVISLINRGVEVTILTTAHANILNDYNLKVLDEILKRTGSPSNLRIFLHPKMVHTKLMVFDGLQAQLGSTNCTALSHDTFEETDLWIQDPSLSKTLEEIVFNHAKHCDRVEDACPYDPVYARVECSLQKAGWYRPEK